MVSCRRERSPPKLAETLVAQTARGDAPVEAHLLLAAAQAQFEASGAALDLAGAEQVIATWGRADHLHGQATGSIGP